MTADGRRPLSLVAPEAALARLLDLLPPAPTRRLPPAKALGCVLAEPLRASSGPVPSASCAARDGWAVAAAETLGAGPYAPVPLSAPPAWVERGTPLPPGADAVLPPFALSEDGPWPEALEPLAPGEGVLPAGGEIPGGALLRDAGQILRPLDLPAFLACGIAEAAVHQPRLALLPIGDELCAGSATDTVTPLLAALVAAEGAEARALPPEPDEAAAIAAALRRAAEGAELVLAVGGTGEGRRDATPAGLAAAGRLLLHGLGARPATTTALGEVAGRPVLLLPGGVEGALAGWYLLARPALRRLSGRALPPPRQAVLARKLASMVGMAELVPLGPGAAPGTLAPLAVGALPLAALAAAEALLIVPPGSEGYETGARIEVLDL
jgi:molybdenum cofactor synthesis domain-containing protein